MATTKITEDTSSWLTKMVEDQLKVGSKEIIERHAKACEQELYQLRQEIVTRAAVRIAKVTQIEFAHDRLIIEIRNPDVQ